MKKLLFVLAAVMLLASLISNAYAEGNYVFDFEINGIDIRVISEKYMSEESAYQIALSIAENEGNASGRGAWCTINGHSMQQSTVVTIQHKYYGTSPRCLQKTYSVNTCTVCGYQESTLLSSIRIYCC